MLSRSVRRIHSSARATLGVSQLPPIRNEPFLHYAPGTAERKALRAAVDRMRKETADVPCIVNGKEIRTGKVEKQLTPSDHAKPVCTYHKADEATVRAAVEASNTARTRWETLPFEDRAAIFLKAADLLSTKYRADLCAATMLGQSKNVWQAEIDAAVETIDFFRFGPKYMAEMYRMQPPEHSATTWNRTEYRALEGFVYAITPFNFTAIGANLPGTPALVGNTVLWKPASTSVYSNYLVMKILQEAGLPPGVINFLPGEGRVVSSVALNSPDLAGLHFTGSTATFQNLWKQMANNIQVYKTYPRIVGETGGKNFHFVHPSADVTNAVHNTVRAAFEYQGQKCSACSRLYVPSNLWPKFKEAMLEDIKQIKMGPPEQFDSFMCAVIDKASFNNIKEYIDHAKQDPSCQIIAGGKYDDSVGYFVEPTVIVTTDPKYKSMVEEIFGPVLTVYVYPENKVDETLQIVDTTSPYALTGSIFAQDRYALEHLSNSLRHSAGNFYINDKCTGAIVGQQPFGGARGSGTNDKSGSSLNYLRWVSARSIKESFLPLTNFKYPHMTPDA